MQEDVENRVHPQGTEPTPEMKKYNSQSGLKEDKNMG